jgi:hypothetical protein
VYNKASKKNYFNMGKKLETNPELYISL